MNWLQIFGCICAFIGLFWVFSYFIKHDDEWYLIPSMVTFLVGIISIPVTGCFYDYTRYKDAQIQYSGELISLENNRGNESNLSGGGSFLGWSVSGRSESATSCSFVTKWTNNNITITTDNTSRIIFHEVEGSQCKVEKHTQVFYYPYKIGGESKNSFWANDRYERHIWVPKDQIKSYIKFN